MHQAKNQAVRNHASCRHCCGCRNSTFIKCCLRITERYLSNATGRMYTERQHGDARHMRGTLIWGIGAGTNTAVGSIVIVDRRCISRCPSNVSHDTNTGGIYVQEQGPMIEGIVVGGIGKRGIGKRGIVVRGIGKRDTHSGKRDGQGG